MCRRRDSNPHSLRHTPLKRACLPISPLRLKKNWCPELDSNQHTLRHYPLKVACLPISPPGQRTFIKGCQRFPGQGRKSKKDLKLYQCIELCRGCLFFGKFMLKILNKAGVFGMFFLANAHSLLILKKNLKLFVGRVLTRFDCILAPG